MSSKTVILTALYDQFISFVNELSQMYPDDPDFSMFLTTLRMLKSTNPSLLPKHIHENTSQYEKEIMEKDEKFFMSNTFDKHDEIDLDILSKLKSYVSTMSPDSKESAWKYCQNIIRLTKAYLGQQTE